MTFLSLLRDNENLSGDMLARIIGSGGGALANIYDAALPPGIGAGSFAVGVVGKMNGPAGADPNHFSVQANGTTLVLTVRPGWIWIRRDSGSVSLDPRCVYVEMTAAQTVTLAANNQGSTRVDQICLRYDLTTPPDATGSNIPSLFVVQGGAASALGAAPADAGTGALYVVLATVTILNTATNVAQSAVADKRYVHPSQFFAGVSLASLATTIPNTATTGIRFDTVDWDKAGLVTLNNGGKTTILVPNTGFVLCTFALLYAAGNYTTIFNAVGGGNFGRRGGQMTVNTTNNPSVPGSIMIPVTQGQLLEMDAFQTSGAGALLFTTAATPYNYFTVEFVGF